MEMYTKEICVEIIESFQKRLMDADNLRPNKDGFRDYKICWQAMRQEGPAILGLAKHLLEYFQETDEWYRENRGIIDRAFYQEGMLEAEREEQREERAYESEQLRKEFEALTPEKREQMRKEREREAEAAEAYLNG
tara:strand:+ start:122 stop:529 length:408 start_codon:yes stop_codon:yes gene_type:complete